MKRTQFFKLHNKMNGRDLVYPSVGLWTSDNLDEAREIKAALQGWYAASGLEFLNEHIVIRDTETDQEFD